MTNGDLNSIQMLIKRFLYICVVRIRSWQRCGEIQVVVPNLRLSGHRNPMIRAKGMSYVNRRQFFFFFCSVCCCFTSIIWKAHGECVRDNNDLIWIIFCQLEHRWPVIATSIGLLQCWHVNNKNKIEKDKTHLLEIDNKHKDNSASEDKYILEWRGASVQRFAWHWWILKRRLFRRDITSVGDDTQKDECNWLKSSGFGQIPLAIDWRLRIFYLSLARPVQAIGYASEVLHRRNTSSLLPKCWQSWFETASTALQRSWLNVLKD